MKSITCLLKDNIKMDIKKIIEVAILAEEKSYEFYIGLSKKTSRHASKILFEHLASEELAHKKALISLDSSKLEFDGSQREFKVLEKLMLTPMNEIGDLIKDLRIAVKKEAESEKSYLILSKRVTDQNQKDLFHDLAQVEHSHKTMIENELKRLE